MPATKFWSGRALTAELCVFGNVRCSYLQPPNATELSRALLVDVSRVLISVAPRAPLASLSGSPQRAEPQREVVLITRSGEVRSSAKSVDGAGRIVVGRMETAGARRALTPPACSALRGVLGALPSAVLREYSGQEDVRTTLALFGHASAIVGVHGAGLVNAVFTSTPACVVEISTWLWHTHSPWRSNRDGVLPWTSERIHWITHRLPWPEFIAGETERQKCARPPAHRLELKIPRLQRCELPIWHFARTVAVISSYAYACGLPYLLRICTSCGASACACACSASLCLATSLRAVNRFLPALRTNESLTAFCVHPDLCW